MKKMLILLIILMLLLSGMIVITLLKLGTKGSSMGNRMTNQMMSSSNTQKLESLAVIETSLPIPPLLNDLNPDPNKAEFQLTIQKGTKEFFNGIKVNTLGYNENYLGPVIRVHKGEEVSIKVKNTLNEQTTVHWHGLLVNGNVDGGPHNAIESGKTWNPTFEINQPAATLWYHPHAIHKTGKQVYMGLAGLFYIDDEHSDQLKIPNDYGVNDIPLIIQDKRFYSDGTFDYNLGMRDVMMGLQGNTILVNGAIQPYLKVQQGEIRFRILNGSNARIYQFHLSNNQAFTQIASDGGLLAKPVSMKQLTLGPGERAEIMIDFSRYQPGKTLFLINQDTSFMKFIVKNQEGKFHSVPTNLAVIQKMNATAAVRTRSFVFQGMGPNVNINGKQMDMNRIDEVVKLHDTEIWEVSNESGGMMGGMGGMTHPFHAHGVQFQILDRNGNPPPPNETGWKDTFLVHPGEKVRVIAIFDYPGIFMYHCHILEHEDSGMMGQFQVKE